MHDGPRLLDRIGFGPRPLDGEIFKRLGAEKYIDEQLHPERIDDKTTEERLVSFPSLRMTPRETIQNYQQPRELARLLIQELTAQKIIRAVHSQRQLQEVMTDFWFNHFNVFWGKNACRWLTTHYETTAIRPHVFGKFKDLLMATAKSPAMLFYLDNHLSSVQRGINENYARELMELHTLGVDGGYTQKDVQEVARAFTGWSIDAPQRSGEFAFRPRTHDDGEKIVLGHKIDAGAIADGEKVLEILANHPSTARFISTKLVRRFVSDSPPESLVTHVTNVYRKTRGDIREMMRTIFTSKEFKTAAAARSKTKTPFEYAVSAIRELDGTTEGSWQLGRTIARMGQPLYQCQPPTGFPDRGDHWMNHGAVIERLNFAVALSANRIPGTAVRPDEPLKAVALRIGSPEFQKK